MFRFPYHVAGKSYSVSVTPTSKGCRLTATAFKDDFSITSSGHTLARALQNLNKKLEEGTTGYVQRLD